MPGSMLPTPSRYMRSSWMPNTIATRMVHCQSSFTPPKTIEKSRLVYDIINRHRDRLSAYSIYVDKNELPGDLKDAGSSMESF